MSPEQQVQPFDEQAALGELERLRESIQAARRARQRTSDEFEAFIKSFRKPAPISELPTSPPLHPPDQLPSAVAVPSNTDLFDDRPAVPLSHLPQRYRLSTWYLGILLLIAVIAVGLVSLRWRREISPPRSGNAVSDSTTPTRNSAASPPAASSPARAIPAAHAVAIELRVIRPVWMRVVVDGRKDVEGTVQAGAPLQFTGDRSIVVRVGNGGDVAVKTGSREESFGPTGQPRTRTFSKP